MEDYNTNPICRICLQANMNLSNIFDQIQSSGGGGTGNTAAQIITECTKYPVIRNDKLPTKICIACLEAARSAHSFKRKTEEAYCRLKALYDITWMAKEENKSEPPTSNTTITGVASSGSVADKYTQTEKSTVFQCESCPQKFFAESELRQHRAKTHVYDGKKCRVCGEKFNHLGQLKVHLSTEHPNEGIRCDFKCPVCQREFTRKDHLKRHLVKVHKIEDENLNISKVSLDEPEIQIENPDSSLPIALNNYSSHWPDYQDEEDEPEAAATQEENVAATNPFSSDEETTEHHNFNNMDEEEVKHFVDTLAQPEISIKVEKADYNDSSSPDKKPPKLHEDISMEDDNKTQVPPLKPERTVEEYEEKIEPDEISDDNIHDEYHSDDHSSEEGGERDRNYTDNEDEDDEGDKNYTDNEDEEEEDEQKEEDADFKPTLTSLDEKRADNKKSRKEIPACSSSSSVKVRRPRRRHGSSKTEDNRCKECDRTFSRYNHLLRHMLTHSSEKPHVCKFCSKGFSRSDHLAKHIQSIHCEKNYKCEQCDSAYGRKDHLQRHIETRHNKNPSAPKPQYECDVCEKKFTTKTYLIRHKLLHTDRLYACKHCTETFTEKEQMKEHQKQKHTQPRNFLCSICGDSFQRNEYLKIHMRRHTGEKPYKCRYCEKGFPRSTDLKMHERYHIGLKPNLCNLCGKGFHRPYNLTIHMRTHTGEKPYRCNQCPQAFAQSNDLKAHIRRHTGERFRCDMCSAAFLQRYGLNAHLRTVHGIVVTSFTGRLRKAEQPGDDAEATGKDILTGDEEQLVPATEHVQHNVDNTTTTTTSPLYLGPHILNPMTAGLAAAASSIDGTLLPPPHPPPTQL